MWNCGLNNNKTKWEGFSLSPFWLDGAHILHENSFNISQYTTRLFLNLFFVFQKYIVAYSDSLYSTKRNIEINKIDKLINNNLID